MCIRDRLTICTFCGTLLWIVSKSICMHPQDSRPKPWPLRIPVSYTHLRAYETTLDRSSAASDVYKRQVNDMHILRHTPLDRQKVYLYAPARFQTETMAIADTCLLYTSPSLRDYTRSLVGSVRCV